MRKELIRLELSGEKVNYDENQYILNEAKEKKITIHASKHMCWYYVLHSTPIQDIAGFFFFKLEV